MDERTRKAIEAIVGATREWEETDDYPRDEDGAIITRDTILEECDIVQAWLEKVSDARKYHLVTLTPKGSKIHCNVDSEEKLYAAIDKEWEQPLSTVYDRMIVIEVDPTGEIEIRPL